MEKHFNTAGPSKPDLHYQINPLSRIDMNSLLSLIRQERYFVLHAPRQTGKTTCLLALRDYLNTQADYAALYVNIEAAQAARSDVAAGIRAVIAEIGSHARRLFGLTDFDAAIPAILAERGAQAALTEVLRRLSESLTRPLILFLDEVDALVGDTLISLLRQIRAGYTDRPKHFPQTIVLCGVRDVRDYRMTMADGEVITGGSAFNIKAESLRLGDFSRAELVALYQQHTDATGQVFTEQALELAWQSTQGQPWLVNALAEQAVWKTSENRDRTLPIDIDRLRAAREALILRNDTHLDQLTDKLKEERVQRVIEPMLMGTEGRANDADLQYLMDLGLIRRDDNRNAVPANQIYAEVLPRVLSNIIQYNMHSERILPSWQDANGRLNARQFLLNFQAFWRKDGEMMMRSAPYHEAAPHLVLMAYLQRVINGGGRIEREYAAGYGRLDLLLVYGDQQMAIEVKVWNDKQADPIVDGLEQTERYLNRLNLADGALVIFDRRSNAPEWAERMSVLDTKTAGGKAVMVLRA
jgi:type II secretory pathway predicted ATPase ExeA